MQRRVGRSSRRHFKRAATVALTRIRWRLRSMAPRSWLDLAKGTAVTVVFFGILECLLRLFGFEFDTVPHKVELFAAEALANANQNGETIQRHPALLWALVPGATLEKSTVNDAGFLGSMPALEPRAGTWRVICLGDSNVALGNEPYPHRLQRLLDTAAPGHFEIINAGVPGYTSLQGLRLLEGRVVHYAPSFVIVQYGWNDHWLSDKPMSERVAAPQKAFAVRRALMHLRTYQLGVYVHARLIEKTKVRQALDYQVPPDDYRQNLQRMVALGNARGFQLVLVTVPDNFRLNRPGPFERLGYHTDDPNPKRRPQQLVEIHRLLNEIVREVARAQSVLLVDLAARFANLSDRDAYFMEDAIHTNDRGRQLIAEELSRRLLDEMALAGAGGARASRRVAGAGGLYTLDDARVMLRNFWPLEQSSVDPRVYEAAIRESSDVKLAGLRAGNHAIELRFSNAASGAVVFVSDGEREASERVTIGADGRAPLRGRHSTGTDGILTLRLFRNAAPPRDPAGSNDVHGPALIGIALTD